MHDEDRGADEEDDELHRHLHHAIEQETESALGHGLSGEIAPYLRLIRAEVGKGEEKAADEARPEGIAVVPIEGEVDGLHPAHPASDMDGIGEGDALGE